jgi:hypothetical protein
MKLSSLLCLATLLAAQICAADDLPNSSFRGFQVPQAARNAAEAPAWNAQAQPATQQAISQPPAATVPAAVPQTQPALIQQTAPLAVPATIPGFAPPPGSAPQVLPANQVPPVNPAFTAPPVVNSKNRDPRPLVSVMKRKTVSTPQSAAPTLATPPPAAPQPVVAAQTPPPTPTPSTTPATLPPDTLSVAQTAGAKPIESAPHTAPTEIPLASAPTTSAPPANTPSTTPPSSVRPAEYDEPIAPSAATSSNNTATPTNNNTSEIPRADSDPSPLQPTKGPVQFVAPPPSDPVSVATPSIVDPQVIPANSNPGTTETPADSQQQAAAHAAADLLAQSIIPGATTDLPGTWQPLSAVIAGLDEQKRLTAVDDYWRLSRAVSDYIWTTDELERLDKAVPARVLVDNPMISTARAIASARVHEAELNVAKAQQSLISLTGTPRTTFAGGILPADRPLVGPYHTYFQEIFANRTAPARARELDAALPIHLKIIDAHAAAVRSAMDAVHYAEEAHAHGEADIRTILACHEDLHKQRRDFLNAIYNYNLDVAEYAATVAAPGTSDDKFVAMLIRPKPADRLSAIPEKPSGDPFSAGTMDSQLRAPRIHNPRQPGSNTAGNHSGNDGWVATPPLRPIEAAVPQPQQKSVEESQAAAPQPPIVNPVNPVGTQSDPFKQSLGDRYGDRYNNRYNESR